MKTRQPNRLIHEKSPYLLQHAYNPVDWYPWGEEAFAKARSEDKPIFVSIGYSTCHWCHVMKREVFENESIAQLMNENLVCVKIDREEQPDIDRVYMSAVQAMTGNGGWPLSLFLTHDLKPFFGGTYFGASSRYGRPGFPQIIKRIGALWATERDKIEESSVGIVEFIAHQPGTEPEQSLDISCMHTFLHQAQAEYDPNNGGFGSAPKFPRPAVLTALFHSCDRLQEQSIDTIPLVTLRNMAKGGIYDYLDGGFHRYSTDERWHLPHFEKMLYDQAQLSIAYLQAYQRTHDETFAEIAKDILGYVLRNLSHSEGGFYSAEDAESARSSDHPEEKEEGIFYLWTQQEVESVLGEDASIVCSYFGIEQQGNIPSNDQSPATDFNVLHRIPDDEKLAGLHSLSPEQVTDIITGSRKKLLERRNCRPRPSTDTKIITAWNGLMISAFARSAQIFQHPPYAEAADRAARFLLNHVYDQKKRMILRRWCDGEARFPGSLQDYSFLIQGLLDLYETTFDLFFLKHSLELQERQLELFWDPNHRGFYDNLPSDAPLSIRTKEDYDGAEPTGNSISALNLLRLSHLTNNPDWRIKAEQTIAAFSNILTERPYALPQMLVAYDWLLAPPVEIILTGNPASRETTELLKEIHSAFLPKKIILFLDTETTKDYFCKFNPALEGFSLDKNQTTVSICRNFACQLPTSDPEVVRRLLK